MDSGLATARARRTALQAECAAQRSGLERQMGTLEDGLRPVDRTIEFVQRYGPILVVAGVAALIVVGPRKALRSVRRALTVAVYVQQARRLFG